MLVVYFIFMLLASYRWFFDLSVHFTPQFTLVAAVCLVLLLFQRRFLLFVILLAATIFIAWPFLSLYAKSTSRKVTDDLTGHYLSILQANVNADNSTADQLISIIRRENPLVITLHEVSDVYMEQVQAALGTQYPHVIARPMSDYSGIAILSQVPIVRHEFHEFSDETPPLVEVELAYEGVRLFSLHALPPLYESWARERNSFLYAVADRVATMEGPLVVSGDFNSTNHSPMFRSMLQAAGLRDARKGFGWKPSWSRNTPFALAIDHILYKGDNIYIDDFRVLPGIGSDHWPVLARLLITNEQ